MHPLVGALSEIAATHPSAHVLLVARELPFASEILREVARNRGALVGWEGTTLRQLATEIAAPALDAAGLLRADDLALQGAADDALDDSAASFPTALQLQVTSLGFRTAAFDAFAQLRIAGVTPQRLRAAARASSPAEALAPAFERYCDLLRERKLSDAADSFTGAIEALTHRTTTGRIVVIEPGAADVSGLPLVFVDALRARGAVFPTLPDSHPDWSAISADLTFGRAASPALEVRDALRHALAAGARWDEVELAVSDVNTYGAALASLGEELGVAYTLKEGVPMIRSRAGRALERYLQWIDAGVPSTPIRHALEQGELLSPDVRVPAAEVARALRSAQIGWGRDRWIAAHDRFEDGSWLRSRLNSRDERDHGEDPVVREERLRLTAGATAALITRLAAVMPDATNALAPLARGWLDLVAPAITSEGEQHTLERLRGRLELLEEYGRSSGTFALALAELRQGLADLRAFPSVGGTRARRVSTPGAVHLTDLSQAGSTGRGRLYLLGLDADRTSTTPNADPILDEETRGRIGADLPSIRSRAARRERSLFRSLNGLSGSVRLSYSTQGDGAGREVSPAPFLRDAAQHAFSSPAMNYDALRAKLGEPVGAARGSAALDQRDVWLRSLASGTVLTDGRAQVRERWPLLARGLDLHASSTSTEATEWHGIVPDAANCTGPFAAAARWTSPSSLELLAKCPLAWFYRYGLEIHPPDDVEYDPGVWLDPRQYGSLLHAILERFVREWMSRQDELGTSAASDALDAIVAEEIERQRSELPPPSEWMFKRECERLERNARFFLDQERDGRDAEWIAVEAEFPARGGESVFTTSDGTRLLIGGRIDRVDRYPDGSLRIVDYKSGGSKRFRMTRKDPPLNGGRMLQPAIYASGASQALGSEVERFEYRFPRERAPDDRVGFDRPALASAPGIVTSLLSHLRTGAFIPTNDATDCKYCDYGAICQVAGDWKTTVSPRATWGSELGEVSPVYTELRRRRSPEDA